MLTININESYIVDESFWYFSTLFRVCMNPIPHPQVEFEVVDRCAGSVAYTTVDGQPQAPSYQVRPYSALKVWESVGKCGEWG